MRKITFLSVLPLLLCMVSTKAAAYDFAAENADGVTIYYNVINDGTEAEVTLKDWSTSCYSGEVKIPETVTYDGKNLSVTSIGAMAFWGDDITYVTIPNSVTNIKQYAFDGCAGLTSVTIPNSVTSIGSNAFSYSGLTSISIPNSVTSIGSSAFFECDALTAVTIPNSITRIEGHLFAYCDNLTSVTIPNSVTRIDERAFYGCESLTSLTIGNSVTSIDQYAFGGCYSLASLVIPNSVTSLSSDAFTGCTGLLSIVVDSDNPNYDSRDNCNAIIKTSSNILFLGCINTVIPNGVASIGNSAFSWCSGLTSIDIPNSVTSIGGFAFSNTGLTSIDIPNSVTSIGDGAFQSCDGLTSVTIPNSVTRIGISAFSGCHGLTSVVIPNSLTYIGSTAFMYCDSLKNVYSLIETPFSIRGDVFGYISDKATLYVPQGTKGVYETTDGWPDNFKHIIEMDEETGVSDIKPEQATKGDAVYSLNGVRVDRPTKGIFIKDGKKVMVK